MTLCKNCKYLKWEGDERYCELKRIENFQYKITEEQAENVMQCDCWFFKRKEHKQKHSKMMKQAMLFSMLNKK